MPRNVSVPWEIEASRTSGTEPWLYFVNIRVPFLIPGTGSREVCYVNDNCDCVMNGKNYKASSFILTPANDSDGELPKATIVTSSVDYELVELIEVTHGAIDAEIDYGLGLRSRGVTEFFISMEFSDITITATDITGTLGFYDLHARASLNQRWEHRTAPGLV